MVTRIRKNKFILFSVLGIIALIIIIILGVHFGSNWIGSISTKFIYYI
jgi:hypothetical protein